MSIDLLIIFLVYNVSGNAQQLFTFLEVVYIGMLYKKKKRSVIKITDTFSVDQLIDYIIN